MSDECADIVVAGDLPESSLTVAQAARMDGGIILPDESDDGPETTLDDWSEQ